MYITVAVLKKVLGGVGSTIDADLLTAEPHLLEAKSRGLTKKGTIWRKKVTGV